MRMVVVMSVIATTLFNMAMSFAESRGSGLAITLEKNNAELEFQNKEKNDKRVWEGHYGNVDFYLEDSAQPVKFEIEPEKYGANNAVDALDNATTTKYYQTFMQQEALSRIFNIQGPQQDMIIKLLYGIFALGALTLLMLVAIYGGG